MKILIIGGMGLIGGAISKAALNRGLEVYIVSRRKLLAEWVELGAHGIQGDWKNDAFSNKIVKEKYDVIVDTQIFTKQHLIRTINIIDGYCKQFIYISTDSVYEHPALDVKEDEKIDISQIEWKYGKDKLKAESFLIKNGYKYNFNWTIIRPTITFGETRVPIGFSSKRNTYTIIKRIIDQKPIIVFDNNNTKHAICHISTFGEAVVELLLNKNAYGECYHISNNTSYTYSEIFSVIEEIVGKKGIYIYANSNMLKKYSKSYYEEMIYDKNPNFTLDNTKIKQLAKNVCFDINLQDVLKQTITHLQELGKEDDEYNCISDSILMEMVNINSEYKNELVYEYVKKFDKYYINKLIKYRRSKRIEQAINSIKAFLSPLKRIKNIL